MCRRPILLLVCTIGVMCMIGLIVTGLIPLDQSTLADLSRHCVPVPKPRVADIIALTSDHAGSKARLAHDAFTHPTGFPPDLFENPGTNLGYSSSKPKEGEQATSRQEFLVESVINDYSPSPDDKPAAVVTSILGAYDWFDDDEAGGRDSINTNDGDIFSERETDPDVPIVADIDPYNWEPVSLGSDGVVLDENSNVTSSDIKSRGDIVNLNTLAADDSLVVEVNVNNDEAESQLPENEDEMISEGYEPGLYEEPAELRSEEFTHGDDIDGADVWIGEGGYGDWEPLHEIRKSSSTETAAEPSEAAISDYDSLSDEKEDNEMADFEISETPLSEALLSESESLADENDDEETDNLTFYELPITNVSMFSYLFRDPAEGTPSPIIQVDMNSFILEPHIVDELKLGIAESIDVGTIIVPPEVILAMEEAGMNKSFTPKNDEPLRQLGPRGSTFPFDMYTRSRNSSYHDIKCSPIGDVNKNLQNSTHLILSGVLFACMTAFMWICTAWMWVRWLKGCSCPAEGQVAEASTVSLIIKSIVACIPFTAHVFHAERTLYQGVNNIEIQGVMQRITVACTLIFVASLGLEVNSLRRGLRKVYHQFEREDSARHPRRYV